MKLGDIYDFFIIQGIVADFRSKGKIRQKLRSAQKAYQKLSAVEKKFFDREELRNPYADTRILFGSRKKDVKRILVGIDIETPEILLAERLAQKAEPVDLILAHHPEGIALAGLDGVMDLQIDLLHKLGLPSDIAESFMRKRIQKVSRRLHSGNHNRTVDVARLLGIPLMCCHTPADNHVSAYLQSIMNKQKPKTLKDVLRLLLREQEYQEALASKCGPKILIGEEKSKAGKIVIDMTGGAEGSEEVFARLSQAGVKTLVSMHLSEEHYRRVKGEHINIIIAGHIASDSLGMNLLLDKLGRKDKFDFLTCSGFRRVKRS